MELAKQLGKAEREALADAYMAWRQERIDAAEAKAQEWWDTIGKDRAKKAAAHTVKCQEYAAHRVELGYANEFGHTFPHIVVELIGRYLAGGVTIKKLGDEYGLSSQRIRQLVAREQRKRREMMRSGTRFIAPAPDCCTGRLTVLSSRPAWVHLHRCGSTKPFEPIWLDEQAVM